MNLRREVYNVPYYLKMISNYTIRMYIKKIIGDHKILEYDTNIFNFKSYLEKIYDTKSLENIYTTSKDFNDATLTNLENVESDLHKIFYNNIKKDDEFKILYCKFIQYIHNNIFPDEEIICYQSFPSIRFQFPNNIAVPPHCDSDKLGNHPNGEKNFLVPITLMINTTRLFIESEPHKNDFQGIDLDYGNLFYFNGNKCIHYNQKNLENYVRISFDFRIILKKDYNNYILNNNIVSTNPRDVKREREPVKMICGHYYQLAYKNEPLTRMINWYNNNNKIVQSRPNFDHNEADTCHTYLLNSDSFITEYKYTTQLENLLKEFINVKHCFMVTSGTSALITSLFACGIKPGDEVIVPNYTMVATANAVSSIGAIPILIDIDPTTYTITSDEILKHITNKTRAVIHVSLCNRNKNLEEIVELCKEKQLWLIEDSAQSVGATYNNKHYGTYGDIGCFSLSTPKIISTGQGGFLVTNNDILAGKIHKIKNFGRQTSGVEKYDSFGLNFKFTDIQSIIGIEQVKKLPARINRYKEIYLQYKKYLVQNESVKLVEAGPDGWIPWFIDIIVKDRDTLAFFLKQHNIETRITYPSIDTIGIYKTNNIFPTSHFISHNGLFLPTHSLLSDNDILYICNIINLFNNC